MKFSAASVIIATLAKSAPSCAATEYYTYFEEGGAGPSNWATVDVEDNQCGGTDGTSGYGQSPVTVSESVVDLCDTNMDAYNFTGGTCKWDQLEFTQSKIGVQVAPKEGSNCSFGKMKIPHTPNEFNALQFHVHTYSEHQIEGKGDGGFFPAELHVVHAESNGDSYAVFGTMIDVGPKHHAVFEYFIQGWEAAHAATDSTCAVDQKRRDLADFTVKQNAVRCPAIGSSTFKTTPAFPDSSPSVYDLPTESEFGVFTYKGGLTIPACTEFVNWNLLDTPMIISQHQMNRLQAVVLCYINQETCAYGTVADENGSTSRPPQPLNGRKVTHRCRNGPDVEYVDAGAAVAGVESNEESGGIVASPAAWLMALGAAIAAFV